MTTSSPTRMLFAHIVDYAGTFPPASLPPDAAAANYAQEQAGADAWMLGRFVIGAQSLEMVGTDPFEFSVVTGPDARDALAKVDAFNTRSAGRTRVAAIEFSPVPATEIGSLMQMTGLAGPAIEIFFETPIDADLPGRLDAIFRAGAAAKIRTGGTSPAAIPSAAALADFLHQCAQRELPFKATAGLHHAVRSCYPLTYERDSATAVMHGFLNVSAASALAAAGASTSDIAAALEESSPQALLKAALGQDPAATRRFFRSFGSCSFREPAEELRRMIADLTASAEGYGAPPQRQRSRKVGTT